MDIKLLQPHPGNARIHSRGQIEQIKASINTFGFTNPILVDASNFVIAGHGRLIAARELGLSFVPVIVLGHLSEAEARALRLADNKIALNAGWDPELLRIEIEEISQDLDIDISVTGFSTGEINVLLSPQPDPDDDNPPPLRMMPRAKTGDIWQLGEHRVGCGDSKDRSFVNAVVGNDEKVDCDFLNPPYNVKIQGHANVKSQHREFAMASGEMDKSQFQSFLTRTLGACVAVSRDGAVHFVCMDWRHYDDLSAICAETYTTQLNLCVWNKSNAGMGSLYRSKHELIFVYRVGEAAHLNTVELGRHGRNRTNVWDYPSVNSFRSGRREELSLHPTVKPVAMVSDAIQDVTRRGDLVLDIFLGSGTTLLACERSKRRFRGIDIDPAYVDLAIDRWVAATNQKPVLTDPGDQA